MHHDAETLEYDAMLTDAYAGLQQQWWRDEDVATLLQGKTDFMEPELTYGEVSWILVMSHDY